MSQYNPSCWSLGPNAPYHYQFGNVLSITYASYSTFSTSSSQPGNWSVGGGYGYSSSVHYYPMQPSTVTVEFDGLTVRAERITRGRSWAEPGVESS